MSTGATSGVLDLQAIIGTAISDLIESGEIEKQITTVVKKTLFQALEAELQSYSDFGKSLKEAVNRSLAFHGDALDIPSYNDAIIKVIQRQVEHAHQGAIERQIAERVKTLLQPAPESITLRALVEQYIAYVKERNSGNCVCYGERSKIHFKYEAKDDFTYIELGEDGEKPVRHFGRYGDIRFGVYKEELFSLTFQNKELEKEMFVGDLHGFERMLFQMKAQKTKVIGLDDWQEIDTSYGDDHD